MQRTPNAEVRAQFGCAVAAQLASSRTHQWRCVGQPPNASNGHRTGPTHEHPTLGQLSLVSVDFLCPPDPGTLTRACLVGPFPCVCVSVWGGFTSRARRFGGGPSVPVSLTEILSGNYSGQVGRLPGV